jgi:hypothetical protein
MSTYTAAHCYTQYQMHSRAHWRILAYYLPLTTALPDIHSSLLHALSHCYTAAHYRTHNNAHSRTRPCALLQTAAQNTTCTAVPTAILLHCRKLPHCCTVLHTPPYTATPPNTATPPHPIAPPHTAATLLRCYTLSRALPHTVTHFRVAVAHCCPLPRCCRPLPYCCRTATALLSQMSQFYIQQRASSLLYILYDNTHNCNHLHYLQVFCIQTAI